MHEIMHRMSSFYIIGCRNRTTTSLVAFEVEQIVIFSSTHLTITSRIYLTMPIYCTTQPSEILEIFYYNSQILQEMNSRTWLCKSSQNDACSRGDLNGKTS
ncbi:hypothetical protein SAY87_011415 [Trapa incisa]|uniref:Uncharacterized protein n=1 Tax=Trapa incisa TaxID=236973 RepID=A0AAN7JJ63_9MYRT|nr:hypothetical protein SAY87_011415 [Trapa incisa]